MALQRNGRIVQCKGEVLITGDDWEKTSQYYIHNSQRGLAQA